MRTRGDAKAGGGGGVDGKESLQRSLINFHFHPGTGAASVFFLGGA